MFRIAEQFLKDLREFCSGFGGFIQLDQRSVRQHRFGYCREV
jgi:hypothetical protein